VATHAVGDIFCLYFWRSPRAPGTLYLARNLFSAQLVCAELIEAGYIVKVIQMGTDVEYEMRKGHLVVSEKRSPKPRRHARRKTA